MILSHLSRPDTFDPSTYYLTYDQIGTLKVVSDASGNVVKKIDYDSFGNIINDTNPSFTIPYSFAGGLNDRDTGLVRFGYRDYDADIGRWTAKDPIFFEGGDTDLYGYCLNDPLNYVDPYGEFWFEAVVIVVLGVIVFEEIIYPLLKPEEREEKLPHIEPTPPGVKDPTKKDRGKRLLRDRNRPCKPVRAPRGVRR